MVIVYISVWYEISLETVFSKIWLLGNLQTRKHMTLLMNGVGISTS